MDTVAKIQDIHPDIFHDEVLLAPHAAFGECAGFLRNLPQNIDDEPRAVVSRAPGFTRHTLSAVPDGFTFQQFSYLFFVARLYRDGDAPRIVFEIFGCRTNGGTNSATHAGMQPFLKPDIFF